MPALELIRSLRNQLPIRRRLIRILRKQARQNLGRPARTLRTNVAITYTSGEQVEVYRFSIPATILIPLGALVLQAFLPIWLPFVRIFDLPLLVTIGFATARRSPLTGLVTGGFIGILQDALTHQPIGLYGISKTVVGFGASSLGIKLDVENVGARFLLTIFFYVVHEVVYFLIARGMVGLRMEWSWPHEFVSGMANAVLGIVVFMLLDRVKQRT